MPGLLAALILGGLAASAALHAWVAMLSIIPVALMGLALNHWGWRVFWSLGMAMCWWLAVSLPGRSRAFVRGLSDDWRSYREDAYRHLGSAATVPAPKPLQLQPMELVAQATSGRRRHAVEFVGQLRVDTR
jgi:hypothetical protein